MLDLAKLARIEMGNEEAESLSGEFDAILGYVGEIKNLKLTANSYKLEASPIKNIMREDTNPHESGIYTEKFLAQAPAREGSYIKVKKIL